ncbi:MAG: DUF4340 domain-containing protein [Verrucomicrobia bacterium]|nr:DUF4340 domain-containing protein [Verrucomicrobiota bacterium]
MKLKSILIAVAVLGALSAVAFFATRPEPPPVADPRVGQSLVDRTVVEKAAKLRFSDQGKTVTLVRQPDATWRVASYHDLPADFSKLSGFIGNLTDAKLDRLVTSSADRIARLEFKDTKIDLLDASDKELWTITLGKNPDTGGGRYVRYGTEQKAFLASLGAYLDTESKNWANTELLALKVDDVMKIEVPFAEGGPVTLTRAKKEDPWTADKTPAGQKVKADRVSSLLSTLSSIRFSDTNEPADPAAVAAKASQRTFKIETFDKKVLTVALGRKPEEKKLKAPAADAKAGPSSLGSAADLAKKGDGKPAEPEKLPTPEFETIPAGPVFVTISNSDAAAPVNALMAKRAFQTSDYTFTGLPQKPDELFEPAPVAAPTKPEEKKVP